MKKLVKIGTRESELATWQASHVKKLLKDNGVDSQLIFIKSEGDINTLTPLYELGVQGIFTKTLDAALLDKRIDIAVHSMKDVPTQPAEGIRQAAVLKRASYKDILVFKGDKNEVEDELRSTSNFQPSAFNIQPSTFTIATSSIRRKAQWLHRYPNHTIESLRGNVNTRLRKLQENNWSGVIFAAAGLERINLRPQNSIDLDWMLPAPAQGAITISCRTDDDATFHLCHPLNDETTFICTEIERDFLRALLGGCSTPISALAIIREDTIIFKGNICSTDGKKKYEIQKEISKVNRNDLGKIAAKELLENEEVKKILFEIRNGK
ncbi:MAG TPA: hydroxymethylbilane synthase [Hanamia sp.]|nr:hydroxymethylbilane synthase [Hanamia sp.]